MGWREFICNIDPDEIPDEIEFNPEELAIRKQNKALMMHFIETLTHKQKIVFREMYIKGRTNREIANQYGANPDSVKWIGNKSLEKWQKYITDHEMGKFEIKTPKPETKPKPKNTRRKYKPYIPPPYDLEKSLNYNGDDDIDLILDILSDGCFEELNDDSDTQD